MKILEDIINEMLLTESVSPDEIISAIDNHEKIILTYKSNGEEGWDQPRIVQPYVYGLTKSSRPCFRGFAEIGASRSGRPRGWKLFRLDRVESFKNTHQKFDKPVEYYDANVPAYNENGDNSMSVVLHQAKFNSLQSDNSNGPKLQQNEPEPYKTDTERNMERLRNQLNNPIKLSDIKTDKGFKGADEIKPQETGPKVAKPNEPYKTDTERNMEKLKKQLDNPTKIDLSQFNKKPNKNDIKNLRDKLGDTSKPITFSDLQQRLGSDKPKPEETTYKTDTERNMERLKKQLDNPTKIDLSRIPKR